MRVRRIPLLERFMSHVTAAPRGCWEWSGATMPLGYGQITDVARRTAGGRRARSRAHRVAYELAYGQIPDGLYVCHRCDTPRCVRPTHLFLGTPKDNYDDMVAKGRARQGLDQRKFLTVCRNGHQRTEENTYVSKNGWRSCRVCHAAGERMRKHRLKAEQIAIDHARGT